MRATGRAPSFWLRLARVRHTARAVLRGDALADAAAGSGFADAHMTREFRRWFGVTPGAVPRNPDVIAGLVVPGYGD